MKTNIITFVVILTLTVCGCKAQKPSNVKIDETAVTFLIDCTDKALVADIREDLRANMNPFIRNLGLGEIRLNEKLTFRIGAIDDSDKLELKSASISLTSNDKKASKREQAAKKNPQPLLQLVSRELDTCQSRCQRKMKCSPIIAVTLKTFREMNPNASREIIVVCTDGVEFSDYANLYKSIPTKDDAVSKVLGKVDNILLDEAKLRIEEVSPQVVFVLKANPKANVAQLKVFYTKLMNQIGVTSISFIDNLSNNPNLN